jgi:hypothetical protein
MATSKKGTAGRAESAPNVRATEKRTGRSGIDISKVSQKLIKRLTQGPEVERRRAALGWLDRI